MKYGIDNLIGIMEDFAKGVQRSRQAEAEAIKRYNSDTAQKEVASLRDSLKQFAKKQAGYFEQQIGETIDAVQKDQGSSKYLSDAGFANAVKIISSGGEKLAGDVIRALVRPYMDDYVARRSVAAILSQQGRDPQSVGIADNADALSILEGVKRDSVFTFFAGDTGADLPMSSTPSVIVHNLNRAAAILEGTYDADTITI